MAAPNTQLIDNFKIPYALSVLDADGDPTSLQPGETVQVVSSDTASISVVPDATPAPGSIASGFIVGQSKLQTGVSVTATVIGADGTTPGLSVQDLFDVVAGTEASIAFNLGSAIPQ